MHFGVPWSILHEYRGCLGLIGTEVAAFNANRMVNPLEEIHLAALEMLIAPNGNYRETHGVDR